MDEEGGYSEAVSEFRNQLLGLNTSLPLVKTPATVYGQRALFLQYHDLEIDEINKYQI